MQGLASGMGTFLGTCIRIPCEVLKQRLQTGKHPNMLQVTPSFLSQNLSTADMTSGLADAAG